MKFHKTAVFCAVVLLSCFCLIGSASSLTYQSSVGVNFTFNPTINLSVGGNLLINNLTPGNSSDSNIIDVAVSTNASYGYVLSATVGQKNGTDSLVNTSNSTYTFTNLSTTAGSATTLSNFADNKWGYSYSVDSGTNWISGSAGSTASGYAGLPLDNNDNAEDRGLGGVTLIDTDNPADNQTIKFKIGAKAANDQAAGTYSNTINFYVVANARPDQTIANSSTMQEVEACPDTLVVGQTYNLEDTRDHQSYNVARLPDGKCWMVENLDLDGGTTLSSSNTDMSSSWTLPTANGFQSGNRLPASTTTFTDDNTVAALRSTNYTNCGGAGISCYGYYTWTAATLGSGLNITGTNENAPYSICPKGWKLPTTYNGNDSSTDFKGLVIAAGGNSSITRYYSSTTPNGAAMKNYLVAAPFSFSYAGVMQGTTPFLSGNVFYYWSRTAYSGTQSYALLGQGNQSASEVNVAGTVNRYYAASVRCVFGN